ncbi:hypothetical protein Acsp04_08780 [Actinomadura sp. NBRC 104425]|nr:hypothetical protein Acsp04_08780 [Actinomadura sp. NBRC 104425]
MAAPVVLTRVPNAADMPLSAVFTQASWTVRAAARPADAADAGDAEDAAGLLGASAAGSPPQPASARQAAARGAAAVMGRNVERNV